ncbi:DUF6712 family protein [Chitinophaga sancti]|uniref:Uncharacterized protein n=1 Tax=Chitinophaga sancti TaxID=1004 RepID=A0A1K1PZV6_9BACT|nr:hypothetical protein [Chitinophaga sancti]WQD61456.1 hypothetical protein U0033_26625 [Chitinophaga sancti]WQG92987.1 hypothetical protein SR876_15815 [Chitinophaga sancti]SFW53175.1 hypothetical protein SAMN05661012_02415 [Chitinophaga sancti]
MDKIILISEKEIKELSIVQLNVDSHILSLSIYDVQFISLRPVLGDELYSQVINEVNQSIQDETYIIPDNMKKLISEYISPYLIHATIQELIMNSTYKLTNKGLLKYTDTSAISLQSGEVETVKNYHNNKVTAYKVALIKYLHDNKLINKPTDTNVTTPGTGWHFINRQQCNN